MDSNIPKVWTFKDENIVKNFNKHVKASVPMYAEIQRMIAEISQFFIRENDIAIDLGCSTGTTMKLIDEAVAKDFRIIGLDSSDQMLKYARDNIHLVAETSFYPKDLNDGINLKDLLKDEPVSLIYSLYTLQFIKLEKRQNLINEIYDLLREDGAFMLAEKIEGTNARFNEMMTDFYQDMKIRNGLTAEQNIQKSHSLRGVMCPITLANNMKLLHDAGFNKIDLVFKWYNFAGILAIK